MTVVCIAGMHRSGTSMVARMLNLSGLYLGPEKEIWDPGPDNPDGFWENIHFTKINEALLAHYKGAWDVPPTAMQNEWASEAGLLQYRLIARDLVDQFKGHEHWGWKDPRNSLTIDFWKTLLPNLKVVVCLRNPLEVFQSLNRRAYSSSKFSFNLWQVYNNNFLSKIPPENRIVTHFDSFFADPQAELIRLLDFLKITPSENQIHDALNSIKVKSRHNIVSAVELMEQAESYETINLYQNLCKQAGPNYEAASGGIVTFSQGDFDDYKTNHSSTILHKELIQVKKTIRSLEDQLLEKTQELQTTKQKSEDQERKLYGEIANINQIVTGQKAFIHELTQKITEITSIKKNYEEEIEKMELEHRLLNAELTEIKTGITWKIYLMAVRIRLWVLPTGSWREKISLALLARIGLLVQSIKNWGRFFKNIYHVQRNDGFIGVKIRAANKLGASNKQTIAISTENFFAEEYSASLTTSSNNQSGLHIPLSTETVDENIPVKLIAFYLPQFHPIPENDLWWGKGFTEWTNVSKAVPQFVGHYQPRLPGELGFYDLRVPEVQYRQIELARQYGISGFCFHYYWFQGKRLLERPLEQFINDPNIDFPFCICWANENWTRRWDGQENDVLIGQTHSEENDLHFIQDVSHLFKHKNYIRINGRPILIVYRANALPTPALTAKRWKEYCKSINMEEPYLIAAQTFYFEDPREIDFDAAVQFPPHSKSQVHINDKLKFLNPKHKGYVVNYADAWPIFADLKKQESYKLFRTVFPAWDNEARKPGQGYTFAFSSPKEYQTWLETVMNWTLKKHPPEERLVFINAWNEWAEGAYLEPDRRFGYAYLQATRDALKRIADWAKQNNEPGRQQSIHNDGES